MTAGSGGPRPHGRRFRASRTEFVRRLLIAGLILVLALVAWKLLDLLLLLFGAVLIAVLLRALANALSAGTRLPPLWSLLLTVAGLAAVFAIVGWLFGAEVGAQMEGLSTRVAEAWRPLQARLTASEVGREAVQSIQAVIFGPAGAGYVARLALVLTNGIGGLFLVVVGGIYLAAQPGLYRGGVLLLVPPSYRPAAAETLDVTAGALRHWLLGQVAIMAIVGTLTGVGAWLIGLPSALALGIIAAVLEFIPFLGPILTAVPAVLLALTVGSEAALWTLGLLLFVQQLEGNLLTPLVQREAVTLPPVVTLFALIGMGMLFGPLGLLLSAPLTVVAYVMVGELYVRRTLGDDIGALHDLAGPAHDSD